MIFNNFFCVRGGIAYFWLCNKNNNLRPHHCVKTWHDGARRRHPHKGKRWVADKYFGTVNGRKWTFAEIKGNEIVKSIQGYSKHKERTGSYAKVGYDRSFYDGDTAYWAERLSKGYGNITPSSSIMLKRQSGICPVCNSRLTGEDLLEAHHIKYRAAGGKNKYSNLVLVHLHCHDKLHREEIKRLKHYGKDQFGNGEQCEAAKDYENLVKNGIYRTHSS